MGDEPNTPDQQVTTPGQPEPAPQAPTNPGTQNWESRYKGSVALVEKLTIENRDLQAQLAQATSTAEQLRAQLSLKDTEKTVAVGERDKQLQELLQGNKTLESEITELKALKLKVEVANKLKRPELLRLANAIPNLTDPEALETVMQDFAGFADDLVRQREQQLMAGVTNTGGGPPSTPAHPSSDDGWQEYINGFELGSPERGKALDAFGDWLQTQHETKI